MSKKLMFVCLLLFAGSLALAADQTWYGVVSDSNCGKKHAVASDEAAACVAKCVSGGGKYVLVSKGKVYQLDPQNKFSDFAGKRVKVSGTLSGETIAASAVAGAPAAKKKEKAGL